ncbi:hypothetical protein F5Y16DRAFT_374857 [Xylariaceae sp. FL0255]|nr:hypothetical protein F5Y16DRAFT_374857 [Xylariaceae sp. FL0255]
MLQLSHMVSQDFNMLPSTTQAGQIRRRRKAMTRRSSQIRCSVSPNWFRRPLSQITDSSHASESPRFPNRRGHSEASRHDIIDLTLSDTDDDSPAHNPLRRGSPPSTPQRPLPRPQSSTPWSSRSAPALLTGESRSRIRSRRDNRGRDVSFQGIDDNIIKLLKKQPLQAEMNREKPGINYVLDVTYADEPQKTIVKIGYTKSTGQQRLEQIRAQCHVFSSFTQKEDPDGDPIFLCHRAEQLVHAELHEYKFHFICTCETEHKEYFEVDKTVAREVVQRWRAFCRSEPYNADGELLPFWIDRLRRLNQLCQKDYRFRPDAEEQERRRMRWKIYTSPSRFERFLFDTSHTWSNLWRWRWQVMALLEALAIVAITFSVNSLSWLIIVLFCIGLEMSGRRSTGIK